MACVPEGAQSSGYECSRGITGRVLVSKSGVHSKGTTFGVIKCILGILLCIEGVLIEEANMGYCVKKKKSQ